MVVRSTCNGLIATTHAEPSPSLDELQDCCGWPVLWGATTRQLQQELQLRCPTCVLFWLEDGHGLGSTARLISWLRERGNRPFRIAAAYQLDAAAEATLREAGAHSFLPIADDVAATVSAALQPLVAAGVGVTNSGIAKSRRSRQRRKAESGLVRPP